MKAEFTFKLSDLTAGLIGSNQWRWEGPCETEFMDGWEADLTVEPISECDLALSHAASNFDKLPAARELQEMLLAAQNDGSADATIIEEYRKVTLGVTIGLRPQRYELFRTFVTLHFGRPDLICRILSGDVMLAASSEGGQIIPNENEFHEGRPFLILGDTAIRFWAKPPA